MAEFSAWPKTPRLFRDIVITEKLDGTNAAIHIERGIAVSEVVFQVAPLRPDEVYADGYVWRVTAQSRKRLITPQADNFGFARWVRDNAADLVLVLGDGTHFGEWWGQGIQRGYGLAERRLSLFNTDKWEHLRTCVGGVRVESVPVLYHGPFSEVEIKHWLKNLAQFGSVAVSDFPDPEGICVWHSQTRSVFKVTLDNYDAGKWESA